MGRAGRAIAGVALIGVGAAIATGWWWPSTASATATLREEVRTVKIDNDSGDVSIRVGEGETTTVHQRIHYNWNQPDEDDVFSLEGGVLVLTDCGWQCDVDYEVVVPRGTAVQGQVNSGDIELSGVDEVDVDANSGDVSLRGITGTVKAEANSGDIEGTGLSGPVDVVANSGDIELALDEAGSVTATANSGNIDLTVPDGSYRVDGDSNSGEREIDITTDPDASHVLNLTAQSGDVSVRTGSR